ncbi:MAG: hypothetical protein IKW48_05455, partial [Akkermansia sp.]|nr:hypothetical protein [Akkermansia sp.]
ISLRASARNFTAGHSALQCKLFRDSAGLWPAGTYFTCIAALNELHRNLPLAEEIASYEASKST